MYGWPSCLGLKRIALPSWSHKWRRREEGEMGERRLNWCNMMNSNDSWRCWFVIMKHPPVFHCLTPISKGSSKLHLLIIFVYLQVDFFPYIKKRHSNFVIYTRTWPFFCYFNHLKAQKSWTSSCHMISYIPPSEMTWIASFQICWCYDLFPWWDTLLLDIFKF